jgi:hypothetical protein
VPAHEGREGRDHGHSGRGEWSHTDLSALTGQWNKRAGRIAKFVETVSGVTAEIETPKGGNSYPTVTVKWDEAAFGLTVAQCDQELRAGEPRMVVLTARQSQPDSGCPGGPQRYQARPLIDCRSSP